MELEKPIVTQEQLDALLKSRLERQERIIRSEYSDYKELKKQLTALEKEKGASLKSLEEERKSREKLEKELAEQKSSYELEKARWDMSEKYDVPRSLLRGTSVEDMQAHAEAIAGYANAIKAPTLEHLGQQQQVKPDAIQEFSNFLENAFNKQ